jgi:hypothetical protein
VLEECECAALKNKLIKCAGSGHLGKGKHRIRVPRCDVSVIEKYLSVKDIVHLCRYVGPER